MPVRTIAPLTAAILLIGGTARAEDRVRLGVENGAATSGHNHLRIPGDSGTTSLRADP